MTGIQWTDETWNPVIGCAKVSQGCKNCYAMSQARRIVAMSRGRDQVSPYERVVKQKDCDKCNGGRHKWVDDGSCKACAGTGSIPVSQWHGNAVFLPERLDQPLRWTKPRRVFVNSMSDLFHEDITFEQIAAVFGVMAEAHTHTFQVLTKRPERALEFFGWVEKQAKDWGDDSEITVLFAYAGGELPRQSCHLWERRMESWFSEDDRWPLPNVWLGVSAEDQNTADERIPLLLQCPAAVRFVSAEPLLGFVDLVKALPIEMQWSHDGFHHGASRDGCPGVVHRYEPETCGLVGLDWVIVGGESGPGARPCDLGWLESIVDQCSAADVAVFVKQLGSNPTQTLEIPATGESESGCPVTSIEHRKGGDPGEWPEGLNVREWPKNKGGQQ